MHPVVTIIVPVYNAEGTLRRCVDSILTQEYADYELILADDGSRDGSGAICDEYAARDPRVRVLHKPNTGVSDTRNQALDRARGVYLQFLDSDDWITPDATKALVQAAETRQCDLVVADFYRVVGERVSRKGDIDEDDVLTREEYAARMMENPADYYYGVLWNKLYRRDIVERRRLRMDPAVSWCEDFLFNLDYIRWARRFCALQVPIYYYVKRKGSLANQNVSISKTLQMKLTVFESYQTFYRDILDEEAYEKNRLKVYKFLLDAAGDGTAPPLPGTRRLGSERARVVPDALEGEGALCDILRERALLDRYLETAALRHGLTLPEARLLLQLRQAGGTSSRQALADFAGLPRGSVSRTLQRLAGRGLVRLEAPQDSAYSQRDRTAACTPEARAVLEDLLAAEADCAAARLSGLTEEERVQYAALERRVRETVRDCLR